MMDSSGQDSDIIASLLTAQMGKGSVELELVDELVMAAVMAIRLLGVHCVALCWAV